MKKLLVSSVLAASSVALVGCASQPGQPGITNQQGGTVVGAVAGGLLGSTIGSGSGQIAATIAGAMVGGFVGSRVGQSMDETARQRAAIASQRAMESGHEEHWQGGNAHGKFAPGPGYYNKRGDRCRRYSSSVVIDGKLHTAHGTACKNPSTGQWEIVR